MCFGKSPPPPTPDYHPSPVAVDNTASVVEKSQTPATPVAPDTPQASDPNQGRYARQGQTGIDVPKM